jgi:hypothetical protein
MGTRSTGMRVIFQPKLNAATDWLLRKVIYTTDAGENINSQVVVRDAPRGLMVTTSTSIAGRVLGNSSRQAAQATHSGISAGHRGGTIQSVHPRDQRRSPNERMGRCCAQMAACYQACMPLARNGQSQPLARAFRRAFERRRQPSKRPPTGRTTCSSSRVFRRLRT